MRKNASSNVRWPAALCAGVLAACAPVARADSTVNASDRYAYGANVGWIDARGNVTNGAVLGQSYCTGYLWGADVGWIGLGNGPANGWQYSNASGADWGVNHDGAGGLTGYAYGANIGWLTFEQTYGRPRVDLATGVLRGYVWGANVGWVGLSNVFARVRTDLLEAGPDTDGDGIPDTWEYRRAGSLRVLAGGGTDTDHDGVSDAEEYVTDTDPLDGLSLLAISGFGRASGTNAVTWTVSPTRQYLLRETAALTGGAAWVDSGLGVMAPGGGPTLTREVVRTNSAAFYRVRAVVPLAP